LSPIIRKVCNQNGSKLRIASRVTPGQLASIELPTFGKLLRRGPVGIARRVLGSAGFAAALMPYLPTRGKRLRVDWRSTTSHVYFAVKRSSNTDQQHEVIQRDVWPT
jgi:hypothetical protein